MIHRPIIMKSNVGNNDEAAASSKSHFTGNSRIRKSLFLRPRAAAVDNNHSDTASTPSSTSQHHVSSPNMTSTTAVAVVTSSRSMGSGFDPNPEIPPSPTQKSHKKQWEGAYRNFLVRGKASSPNTISASSSPASSGGLSSKSPERSVSGGNNNTMTSRKPGFALLAGTKRLVAKLPHTPQSVPDGHHRAVRCHMDELDITVPPMPNLRSSSDLGGMGYAPTTSLTGPMTSRSTNCMSSSSHQQQHRPRGHHKASSLTNFSVGGDSSTGSFGSGKIDHSEKGVRGGKFFKGVFSRSTSDTTAVLPALRRRTNSKASSDELDAPLRKGVEKGVGGGGCSPELYGTHHVNVHHHHYLHPAEMGPSPPTHIQVTTGTTTSEVPTPEDDDDLDSLLARASSTGGSPHTCYGSASTMGRASSMQMLPNSSSPHSCYGPPATTSTASMGRASSMQMLPTYQQQQFDYDVRRSAWSQVTSCQPDIIPEGEYMYIEDNNNFEPLSSTATESSTTDNNNINGRRRSLLAQQFEMYDELDTQHHHHVDSKQEQQNQPATMALEQQHCNPREPPLPPPRNFANLDAVLSDPSFTTCSIASSTPSPSSFLFRKAPQDLQQRQPNPEMKKMFTNFHNQAKFARDSTSPFLGDDSSNNLRQDAYLSYNTTMVMNRGLGVGLSSVPQQFYSERGLTSSPVNISTSLPLETVDELNLTIHKSMRLLKPVEGTESWQQGRRYLIAPAALAACPLAVVNKLSGNTIYSAADATSDDSACSSSSSMATSFGTIDLGPCLITYVGEKHHLSFGKWSSTRLVLRQNYLLEYDLETPLTGLPRGFCHLQHAVAYPHDQFQDALELQFYASPCALADQRVLMIRVQNRKDRDNWITCLNDAAKLNIENLWEFDKEKKFGSGRYASVYPARRKTTQFFEEEEQAKSNSESDGSSQPRFAIEKCDCALKIVDKKEFWRRVVKGRERADTLVRELSVQSTLTAKCGKVPTFLQLRGFFETSEHVVMELELLEGTDLFGHISSQDVIKEAEAARIMKDVLTSIDAMNRVGIAHRDIKPANVLMCSRDGKDGVSVKVGDFGMSTFVGVDGCIRGRCGTPGYVAPEILKAGTRVGYGNKVDVFSAGVTLYVMLCGYEPFYGETEKELIEANKVAALDFPEADWKDISTEARELIKKMTASDPTDRLSAKEALQHGWFARFLKGQGQPLVNDDENKNKTNAATGTIMSIALPALDTPQQGACTIS